MPVSGKLSLGLSEKLGEEVASELINQFNQMEATHQSEYKELRLDIARLEHRMVEFRSELKQDMASLGGELSAKIASVQSELIKWTFVFWLGTIGIVMLLLRFFAEGA